MNRGALSSLKVLEYGEFISAAYCGKLFADLGAEVIKIEKPGFGDKARSRGPFPKDIPHLERSGMFLFLNTNKLGVTLNLRSAAGGRIFRELAKRADILLETNTPQEMKRLGLDYESLHKLNPGLVVTSITPFGQTGPYRDYKACDLTSFYVGGESYLNPANGVDDTERQSPLKVSPHGADMRAGLIAAIGTMSAVIARQINGLGQQVDLSQQEALALLVLREVGLYTYDSLLPSRNKGRIDTEGTRYPCKDGYVVILTSTDLFWAGLVEMMGNPDWTQSEWCQNHILRRAHWDAIELLIGEWTREHTTDEVSQAARAKRVPCSTVQSVKDLFNTEQLAVREFFIEIEHKEAGKFKYPGAPYKLSATPWSVRRPAPLLGEHNEEVYCQMLGYTGQDLVKLRQAGVI